MKSVIHFYISRGENNYVAEGVELAIVTQAETLDELIKNIHQATKLHLEAGTPAEFGLVSSPLISVNFEFPQFLHA